MVPKAESVAPPRERITFPRLPTMTGFVTTRDLLTCSPTIIHEFGTRCYVRCIWRTLTAHRPVTFLECLEFSACDRASKPKDKGKEDEPGHDVPGWPRCHEHSAAFHG